MPIADEPIIIEALRLLEAAAEGKGWDQPAGLYIIETEKVVGDLGALTAVDFPGFDTAYHATGNSCHAVQQLSRFLGSPDDKEAAVRLRSVLSGVVGLALVDEGWAIPARPDEPEPTEPLANHPDRSERRFAIFVGIDGSVTSVIRTRGEQPRVDNSGHGRISFTLLSLLATLTDIE